MWPGNADVGGGIIGLAIARPVSVLVGVILVILFGALSIAGLPIQLTPDVSVPTLSVSTQWPGATPLEVEAEILEPQEEALKSLPGLERMLSDARRGRASITLELEVGTELDEALVRASNLLSQVPSYPQAVRQPVVSTSGDSGPAMAVLIVQSDPPGRSVAEYRTWFDETIVPRIERIPGVGGMRVFGGQQAEVHVDFDPRKLAARALSVGDLSRAVEGELRDVSGGDISVGKRRLLVRTEVMPPEPKDLARAVIQSAPDGTPILIGDVAEVSVGLRKAEYVGFVNGSPSMGMLLFREPGSNVLQVTRDIYRVVDELQERYLAREGLELRVVSDQVGYIEGALALVKQNLLLGGALAVLVLLVFLRSLGASAVVAVSIPVSIVGTVLGMSLMGRSINLVSLAGMAFAVGMVVDNSIVVLENIDTSRRAGLSPAEAARRGTVEVWSAILASTLTTAAVFLPIIGWVDEVGELLRDVALAVSIAVFVSLVVSVLVIPSFSARLLKRSLESGAGGTSRPARWVRGVVYGIARSPLRSLLVAVVGLGATTALGLSLIPPLEYLPTGNRNVVFGMVFPPPGYGVGEVESIGRQIQANLLQHRGKQVDGKPSLDRAFFVGGPDFTFMGAVAEDPQRVGEVAQLVRDAQAQIPGVFGFASQASLFGRNLGGGRVIEVDISGADMGQNLALGGRLMGELSKALPGAQLRPVPGLDPGAPELQVTPKRAQAARMGVASGELGQWVDAYVDGAIVGELGKAGEPKRDVVLRAAGLAIDDPASLRAAPVAVAGGRVVPLGQIADVHEKLGPIKVRRIERRRAITLQVRPPPDMALESAIATVRSVIDPLERDASIPPGVRVDITGSAGKLDAARERFVQVLLLAVVICFLLLAALFEDFLAPLAILVSVPLAGSGGVLALRAVDAWLAPQSLDMMTALGFVILIGVVVNNAILVVDGALVRMRDGVALDAAVADAVQRRVRPIFMSVLTSLAGLLPLVIFPGSGSELYRGVGAVVLGGLGLSTALTLFLVPAVFSLLWRVRRRLVPATEPSLAQTPGVDLSASQKP